MVLNIAIKFKYMHTFIKKHRTRASPASEDQLSKIPPFPTKWVLGVCVCVCQPLCLRVPTVRFGIFLPAGACDTLILSHATKLWTRVEWEGKLGQFPVPATQLLITRCPISFFCFHGGS